MVDIISNVKIDLIVSPNRNDISIMICTSLAESTSHFLWPEEFDNVANPGFENLKHLKNPGHLPLTAPSTPLDTALPCIKSHGERNYPGLNNLE